MRTAGFVLAGGASSRMGRDKALLPLPSGPLITQLAREVAAAAGTVALVAEPGRYQHLGFDALPDLRRGAGPLGGIETALASGRGQLNLILACDMPGVRRDLLRSLLETANVGPAMCLAARDALGSVHPLCAVYRSSCLYAVRDAIDAGRVRLLEFLRDIHACYFDVDHALSNVNTPQDWAEWELAQNQ